MNISCSKMLFLFLIVQAALSIQLPEAHDIQHEFCWKDSHGRGVGTIPSDCGNRLKIGLLCYDHCPSGYSRFGFDCHQHCPSGWRNDGLFCRNAEYGRGGGYPWKFGDGFNNRGMYKRCERDHGRGKCEQWGAIVYPKCKPGFSPFGCCICRPAKPNCNALGMNGGIDLSCAKRIKIGTPYTANCPPGKQNNAGLCYKPCNAGFYGVGPVCWANTPPGWVGCGMGAAVSSKACASVIIDQVTSVGTIALNIATLGSSGGATTAANAAQGASKLAKLRQQLSSLKNTFKASQQIGKLIKKSTNIVKGVEKAVDLFDKAQTVVGVVQQLDSSDPGKMTEADIVRLTAEIASIADPTGIASTVAAYSHPKCSQIMDEIKGKGPTVGSSSSSGDDDDDE